MAGLKECHPPSTHVSLWSLHPLFNTKPIISFLGPMAQWGTYYLPCTGRAIVAPVNSRRTWSSFKEEVILKPRSVHKRRGVSSRGGGGQALCNPHTSTQQIVISEMEVTLTAQQRTEYPFTSRCNRLKKRGWYRRKGYAAPFIDGYVHLPLQKATKAARWCARWWWKMSAGCHLTWWKVRQGPLCTISTSTVRVKTK